MESTYMYMYYAAASVHFPDACYYCGQFEPPQLLDDEYTVYQAVEDDRYSMSLCTKCRSIAKQKLHVEGRAKTTCRGPSNVVQSSKGRKIN